MSPPRPAADPVPEQRVRALKHAVLRAGFRAGFFQLVQFARRRQAVILTFHRFSGDGEGDPRGVPVTRFAECMGYLAAHYRVVSLAELATLLRRGAVAPNAAAVTIDDGYHDAFSLAAPVLRRYQIPASVFVVSDFVDSRRWLWPDRFRYVLERAPRGPVAFSHRGSTHVLALDGDGDRRRAEERWCEHAKSLEVAEREDLLGVIVEACGVEIPVSPPPGYRSMTWAQLRALAAEGFDVGAHTRTHPILSRVPAAQLQDEIGGCKEQIEHNLRVPVRHFAYPNGRRKDYTSEAVAAVARAGYLAAVTSVPAGNSPSTPIFELHRISERAEDVAHFAQSVSGFDLLKGRVRARPRD